MKFRCRKNNSHVTESIDWSKGTDGGPVPYVDLTGHACPICGHELEPEVTAMEEAAK